MVIGWAGARNALMVFALLALSACQTSSLIQTRADDPDNLPEDYGLVAFKVISNTDRLAPSLRNWTGAFAVDLNDPENRYLLTAGGTGLNTSRVFVGAMPPGEYGIFMLQSLRRTGDGSTWLNARVPRSLGNFRVEEGHLTNLGTLVYQPLGKFGEGRDQANLYVIARFDDDEPLEAYVAESFPEAWAGLHGDQLLGWEPDGNHEGRSEMADRLRRFARGIEPHHLMDGQMVMTAPMGQIRVREGEGSWRRIDTGQNRHLGTLTLHGEGYLAGGERGLILQAPTLEGPWQLLPGPSTQENIIWLYSDPVGGVVALTEQEREVRLYAVSPDFSSWRTVAEIDNRPPPGYPGVLLKVSAARTSDGRVVVHGGRQRLVYDLISGEIERDERHDYYRFHRQPDGTFVAVPGHWWTGVANPVFSVDDGLSWTTLQPIREAESWPRPALPIVLAEDRFAMISHRIESHPQARRRRYSDEFNARVGSTDAIVHWGEPLEKGCNRLVPEFSSLDHLFVACEDGRLMVSRDEGRTWSLDLDTTMNEDDRSGSPPRQGTI